MIPNPSRPPHGKVLSRLRTDDIAHPLGQGHSLLAREVHPDRGGATGCVYLARLVGPLHRDPGLESGARRVTHIHLDADIAGVAQLAIKIAKRIDDDGAFAMRAGGASDEAHPVDAGRLHVTEIHRVIDMAHRIHIAPAHGDEHLIDEFLGFWNFDSHGVKARTGQGLVH